MLVALDADAQVDGTTVGYRGGTRWLEELGGNDGRRSRFRRKLT